ncbi:MAG TPA: hypothetical protein VEQ67_00530, partial [Mycobacterium sp.]|nr:hypothetical protein [Mycobacterium sp.]
PGTASFASVRMAPRQRFLTGPPKTNPYKVLVHQDGLPTITVDGTMQQEGLIPPWLLPALIGLAALALLLVLLWFVLLKPSIQSAATAAVAPQASSLQSQVNTLKAQNPAPAGGGGGGATGANPFGGNAYAARLSGGGNLTIPADGGLSVTDLVFENPNGYSGDLTLLRFNAEKKQEQVLLTLKLDNFRDLDFHFITPLTFQKNDRMELVCVQPDKSPCDAAVYYSGYFKNPPQ